MNSLCDFGTPVSIRRSIAFTNRSREWNEDNPKPAIFRLKIFRNLLGIFLPGALAICHLVAQNPPANPMLGTSSLIVGSAGGPSSVLLSDSGDWTAVSNSPFLHVSSGSTSGTGNALIVFTVDPFTGTGTQTGTLTIAGLTLTITQVGPGYLAPTQATPTQISSGHAAYQFAFDTSGNAYLADANA